MRTVIAVGLIAAVVAAPFVYWSQTSVRYRNLRIVEPGVLLRSGQMTPAGFRRVAHEFGVRTVISFRDTKDDTGTQQDQAEEDFCKANGCTFYRLPPADWTPVNGVVPGDRTIADFLHILDDPKTQRPVLVHCFAGIHRTGAHCAVYRMEYNGWPAAAAVAEMRTMGTPRTTFADNLLNYLGGYTKGRLR